MKVHALGHAAIKVRDVERGERFVCFKDPDGAILELLEILR